ncbi:hypothetical protein GWI33_019871 [Rhynchophorus ferrugineus]|uniref:Uncharacterized protein n=1 Tax=Rhynchophorus ferrugineus TaxID=354439 RepID=A0A834HSM6_RHYFE|nr:hypothetical protein GWI33_019871 [Rhynchophorus ferrugineus]
MKVRTRCQKFVFCFFSAAVSTERNKRNGLGPSRIFTSIEGADRDCSWAGDVEREGGGGALRRAKVSRGGSEIRAGRGVSVVCFSFVINFGGAMKEK